ncbi:MAG: hypothetical protein ACR2I2_08560 [Bryobacteraceae bacterium]
MNCEDFEPILIEVARGVLNSGALAHAEAHADAHAEMCRACALQLANQRALSAGFASIVKKPEDAPADLETILLAAFAKRAKRRAVWKRAWVTAGGAIAAAVILATIWRTPQREVLHALPFKAQRAPLVQAAAIPPESPPVLARPKRRHPRKPPQPTETASEFYPIPYADPLTPVERAEVVRVRVDDRLNAELIVGQDGLARAIRFINASQ